MSVTVVKIGPEARAGSTFIRFNIRGMVPPSDTATTVLIASAPPTTSPRETLLFHNQAAAPISNPNTRPLIKPTETSCSQTLKTS